MTWPPHPWLSKLIGRRGGYSPFAASYPGLKMAAGAASIPMNAASRKGMIGGIGLGHIEVNGLLGGDTHADRSNLLLDGELAIGHLAIKWVSKCGRIFPSSCCSCYGVKTQSFRVFPSVCLKASSPPVVGGEAADGSN